MSGYTTLKIADETIALKFGLPALQMIDAKMKKLTKIPRIGDTYDPIFVAYIIYAAYYNNCMIKDIDPQHDFEYFSDYFEATNDKEFFTNVESAMKIFNESINSFNAKFDEQKKTIVQTAEEPKEIGNKLNETALSSV